MFCFFEHTCIQTNEGGGLRKRIGLHTIPEEAPHALGKFMTKMWSKGKLTPKDVGQGARAGLVGQGASSSASLQKLSKLDEGRVGSGGNGHRDLMRYLGKNSKMPLTYQAMIPVWSNRLQKQVETVVNFILPFELLDALIGDSLGEWTQFGSHQIDLEADFTQKCRSLNLDRSKTVSLGLWGDGAPFSNRDSVNLLLFNVLTGGSRSLIRYWICCFPKFLECHCGCKGACTWTGIFAVITWAFMAMYAGHYPPKRHDDIPWHLSKFKNDKDRARKFENVTRVPLKFFALLHRLRGDWMFFKQVCHLQGWKDAAACCFKCVCVCEMQLDYMNAAQMLSGANDFLRIWSGWH